LVAEATTNKKKKREKNFFFFLRRDVCVCMRLSRMFSLYYSVASTRFVLFRPLMAAAACVPDLYKNLHAIFAVSCDVLIVLLHSQ
jgi:hypothetical protein